MDLTNRSFWIRGLPGSSAKSNPDTPVVADSQEQPPPGYVYVTRTYRVLPDGTRDYAIYHGDRAYRVLQPVSSHLHRRR